MKYTLANVRWTIDEVAGQLIGEFMQGPAPDDPDPMNFSADETYRVLLDYADLQIIPIEQPTPIEDLEGVSPTNEG